MLHENKVLGDDLVAYVSNERGISPGEAKRLLDQRRIRLGVGLTGQQFLDYTPVPLIAGGEKQIDVGGVLGDLSARYQKVTGDPSVFVDGLESLDVMANDVNRRTKKPMLGGANVTRITGNQSIQSSAEGVNPGILEALNKLVMTQMVRLTLRELSIFRKLLTEAVCLTSTVVVKPLVRTSRCQPLAALVTNQSSQLFDQTVQPTSVHVSLIRRCRD